jgi:hypothetical protein
MGLGDSLKKWATSKATEMLTADGDKRESAAASADAAESQARSDLGETLLRTAFPKVGQWADQQEAARGQREADRVAQEQAEIAALPMAAVRLTATGDYAAGQWSGELHLAWKQLEAEVPDPEYPSPDPYAARPGVSVDLFVGAGSGPVLGDLVMTHWGFQIPGFTGDGTYDLTAIAHEREPAALTYEEWSIDFLDAEDSSAYFFVDAGRSSVTVAEGGTRLSVTTALSGARGALTVVAEISRPLPGAAG